MKEQSCLSTEEHLRSETDPALRDRLLDHAAGCLRCQALLEAVEVGVAAPESAARGAAGRRPWRRYGWAAAAAVLLAAIAAGFLSGGSPALPTAPVSYRLPAGDPVGAAAAEYAASASVDRFLSLPDGSRLRLEPGAHLRTLSPASGERARLEIVSGAIEAEVAPGKGAFRIRGKAGEVEVLGTRFRSHAFELRSPGAAPAASPLSCLCVEVYDGKVRLGNAAGGIPVTAGERGVIVGGRSPEKQTIGTDWRAPFALFARLVRQTPEGSSVPPESRAQAELLAAILRGSRWEGVAANGTRPSFFEDAPDDSSEARAARSALKEMIGGGRQ